MFLVGQCSIQRHTEVNGMWVVFETLTIQGDIQFMTGAGIVEVEYT